MTDWYYTFTLWMSCFPSKLKLLCLVILLAITNSLYWVGDQFVAYNCFKPSKWNVFWETAEPSLMWIWNDVNAFWMYQPLKKVELNKRGCGFAAHLHWQKYEKHPTFIFRLWITQGRGKKNCPHFRWVNFVFFPACVTLFLSHGYRVLLIGTGSKGKSF